MLTTAAILACESAVNTALRSDSVTCAALAKISGSVFEFKTDDAPIHFYLIPLTSGINLQSHFPGTADTRFSGTFNHFCQLAKSEDSASALFGNGVTISGDHQLANKLQRIIKQIDIDWQGLIAEHSSDLFASQLAGIFNTLSKQASLMGKSFELNLAEYLQEEAHYLPSAPEVEYFLEESAQLQQQTERLEARLALLSDKLSR